MTKLICYNVTKSYHDGVSQDMLGVGVVGLAGDVGLHNLIYDFSKLLEIVP